MLIPEAFYKLCGCFFQDIGVDNPDQSDWVDFAAQHLNASEKQDVKDFLVDLTNSSMSDGDLQKIWFKSSAEIYFPKADDLRKFLGMIRDRVI